MSDIQVGDLVYIKYAYHQGEVTNPLHGVVTEIREDTLRSTRLKNIRGAYSLCRLRRLNFTLQDEIFVFGAPVWLPNITEVPGYDQV